MDQPRRHLPLAEFRQRLLTCQACFPSGTGCKHHEDVLGGYGTGRIVVVGVNPQASPQDGVYDAIQKASWSTKLTLSDRLLDVYAKRIGFEQIAPGWGWMQGKHRGVRDWLPLIQKCLGVPSAEALADQFAFVEAFKHATASQAALREESAWRDIERNCPELWLTEQLRRLGPKAIVLCGASGMRLVAPLIDVGLGGGTIARTAVSDLHGTTHDVTLGAGSVPVLFTLAVSKQTAGRWKRHPGSTQVREVIARWLQ